MITALNILVGFLFGVMLGAAFSEDHGSRGVVAFAAILGLIGVGLFALGRALA